MKRQLYHVTVLFLAAFTLFSCSKGYESQKSDGNTRITLSVDRYPLVKGDNTLNVKIAEAAGAAVNDATVTVHYFMPPMPGMAPMDFTTQAVPKGDHYSFSANVPMEGGWKMEVAIARSGKPAASAVFNLDAR